MSVAEQIVLKESSMMNAKENREPDKPRRY